MGNQPRLSLPRRSSIVSRSVAGLVEQATQLLDPNEREVVRGDFAENGASNGKALIDVLGLIVRRQTALWLAWRPWAALIFVVVPLGMLLSLISRLWADGTSVDAWIYLGHWDWSFFQYPGLRADLLRVLFLTIRDYVALTGWAWTCGFAIAALSRRTAWVNALIFYVILFAATIGSSTVMRSGASSGPGPASVFMSAIATTVVPLLVKLLAVAIPATFGIRRALSGQTMALRTAWLWTFAIAAITVSSRTAVEESASFFGWRPFGPMPNPGFDHNLGTSDDIIDWKLRFLPFVVMWPAVYMLATSIWERLVTDDDQRRTR